MFLFMAEEYSIVYIYHSFFIHSSVYGHLGCFHVLVIVNSAATNNRTSVFLWFPQGLCLGVGLLDHMVVLFLVFKGISISSSIVAVSIYIPTNSARVFPFLHTLSSVYCLRLFDKGHSDWCEMISHCSFDLHFSNSDVEHLFMC